MMDSGSIDRTDGTFNTLKYYEIDFDKVKKIEDVVIILKNLNLQVRAHNEDEYPELKPYLKEHGKD